MSKLKKTMNINVFDAAKKRIEYAFDHFERIYISFSGGKDSTVMLHMVMDEAIKRDRIVGVLIIDLEAQYSATISHMEALVDHYKNNISLHWICLPIKLRNAVSNFEPCWCCWQPEKESEWVRGKPSHASTTKYPFFQDWMEFEEFMVLWGHWFSEGKTTAGFVGIRCDESLNRFRTISSSKKEMHGSARFTTRIIDNLYNVYPLYDWKTSDIWTYHAKYPEKRHNTIYDQMHKAGLSIHQMRLCQPYGDDQRRGLWLYHILEPQTWYKVVNRVNGANSGSLYIEEKGNITGYDKIHKPKNHTWKSFCELLLKTMPEKTRNHFVERFKVFIKGWKGRGYINGIPDEAPYVLEKKQWAPSYRRLCKVLLRNDWWCKGLGLVQPKSEAYAKYLDIKKNKNDTAK